LRALVQRVVHASIVIDGVAGGEIGIGLVVLLGVHRNDTSDEAKKLAQKVLGLRIFNDEAGKMNLALESVTDPTRGLLVVSNFTLYGDGITSRRPSFTASAPFDQGERLYEEFLSELRKGNERIVTGKFGADMQIALVNDGPVTLMLEVLARSEVGTSA